MPPLINTCMEDFEIILPGMQCKSEHIICGFDPKLLNFLKTVKDASSEPAEEWIKRLVNQLISFSD